MSAQTLQSPPQSDPVVPGQRARNWFSGETMTFHHTSSESEGRLIEMDLRLRQLGAPGGAPHRHSPTERFEITSGMLCAWIAGHPPQLVRRGDVFEIPSGRWHFVFALLPSRARVTIRPGMRFDELLVDWAKLGSGEWSQTRIRRVLSLLRRHGCL